MPHDLIDNQSTKLIDAIQQTLPGSAAAHFAVGYFFLSGLEAVADKLANMQELRLPIGVKHAQTRYNELYRCINRLQAANRLQ